MKIIDRIAQFFGGSRGVRLPLEITLEQIGKVRRIDSAKMKAEGKHDPDKTSGLSSGQRSRVSKLPSEAGRGDLRHLEKGSPEGR